MAQNKGDDVAVLSDSLLLERIDQGDTTSFETVFYRHYDRVYGLLFRLVSNRAEAEDLTQEVFVKLYKQKFRPGQDHNISAWLYRVATNMGYNAIRSRKRRWQRNTALLPDPSDMPLSPAEKLSQAETRALVQTALAQLKPQQGQLLLLRQMGLSYAELAETCQVSPGSVGTLLRRASDAFRQAYEKHIQVDDF